MDEDLRKVYAPVFEVALHLSVPEESGSSESSTENSHEADKSSEGSKSCEDEASKNEVGCLIRHSSEELPIMQKTENVSSNLEGILSGKMKKAGKNEGKWPNSWKRQMREILAVYI